MCFHKHLSNSIISPYFQKSPQLIVAPRFPSTHFAARLVSYAAVCQVSTSVFNPQCTVFWFASYIKSRFHSNHDSFGNEQSPDFIRRTMVWLFGPHQSSNACSHLSKWTTLTELNALWFNWNGPNTVDVKAPLSSNKSRKLQEFKTVIFSFFERCWSFYLCLLTFIIFIALCQ